MTSPTTTSNAFTLAIPTETAVDELDFSSDRAWLAYTRARDEMLGGDACETLRFTDRRRGWRAGEVQTYLDSSPETA